MKTVPCEFCGEPTHLLVTKLCDRCLDLMTRITADTELVRKILAEVDKVRRPR